jgi:hypothetical protein
VNPTPYHLVIVRDLGREVLIHRERGYPFPIVEVPRGERLVRAVTEEFYRQYGLDLFILCAFTGAEPAFVDDPEDITWRAAPGSERNVLVCRPFDLNAPVPPRLTWQRVADLDLGTAAAQIALQSVQELWDRLVGRHLGECGKFTWPERLLEWTAPFLDGEPVLRARHWNGLETWCLLRVETANRALWFKAAGEPNEREARITYGLHLLGLPYLPKAFCYKREWRGVLLEHIPGETLHDCDDPFIWFEAARRLAAIQIETVHRRDGVHASGCDIMFIEHFRDSVEPLMAVMKQAYAKQAKQQPAPLTPEQLDSLGRRLRRACDEFEKLEFPYALTHGDFSPHNTIVDPVRGPIFIDWALSYLSFPLLTFDYFINRMKKDSPPRASFAGSMEEAYLTPWFASAGKRTTVEAYRYAPVFARLLLAITSAKAEPVTFMDKYFPQDRVEREATVLENDGKCAWLRSLVRSLAREVDALEIPDDAPKKWFDFVFAGAR